jgi:cobalt/nickel transport system permease protein
VINRLLRNNAFIERSLLSALSFIKDSVYAEEIALRNGILQSISPKIKVVAFLLIIIGTLFIKDLRALLMVYAFCIILAIASKLSLKSFIARTWVFIPLFSLFIALPAIFSIFSPGEAMVTWNILGQAVSITKQGLNGALIFVVRVTTCVSFAALLSLTTKHTDLLKTLRLFGIPKIYIMVFGMCYRYIFLFVEIIENTYLAIKSRVGSRLHYEKGQRVVSWNIGNLWMRSYHLSNDVYKAMLSRGYNGEG